jgi:hypothetical protein
MDTVERVLPKLCGCREGSGQAVSHVAGVERLVISSKSVDHLILVSYRYNDPWADGEVTRDKAKFLIVTVIEAIGLTGAGKVDDEEVSVTLPVAQPVTSHRHTIVANIAAR